MARGRSALLRALAAAAPCLGLLALIDGLCLGRLGPLFTAAAAPLVGLGGGAPGARALLPGRRRSGRPAAPRASLPPDGQAHEGADAGPYPPPRPGVDWEALGFGLTTKDTTVAIARCSRGGDWGTYALEPYGPLSLEPAATILNYGQGIFEGLKARRTSRGRIVLFRPERNARRMADGARRFAMPPVPTELFLEMSAAVVRANADWVPPAGSGELYLRPLLFGSGGALGVGASPEFTLVIYAAPVGRYFKGGSGGGARMRLEVDHQRAATRGIGDVKAAGNYAPCFTAQQRARADGFSDIVYLDASGRHIEEAAASNLFCVGEDGVLRTPSLGTILPGVTRDSVITLAENLAASGSQEIRGVEVGDVSVDVLMASTEAFVTGTGAGITPIEHIACTSGRAVDLRCPGPGTEALRGALQDIQAEEAPDALGWLWDPLAGETPAGRAALAEAAGGDLVAA